MYNERQNMRAAAQPVRVPPWELVALDADGNELYRTEYADTKAEAELLVTELNSSNGPDVPENVAQFDVAPSE